MAVLERVRLGLRAGSAPRASAQLVSAPRRLALRSSTLLTAAVLASLSGGCSIGRYQPCPVELTAPLPADAFARCKTVLLARYGKLDVVDPERFLLQTPWVPVDDPTGERRVAVFRDPEQPEDLAVVVELRWPEIPVFGPPRWAVPRGDALAERALATELRQALDAAR